MSRYQALEAEWERLSKETGERLSFSFENIFEKWFGNFFAKIGMLVMKFVVNPFERVVINLLLPVVDLLIIVRNGFATVVSKWLKKVKYFFKMKKR